MGPAQDPCVFPQEVLPLQVSRGCPGFTEDWAGGRRAGRPGQAPWGLAREPGPGPLWADPLPHPRLLGGCQAADGCALGKGKANSRPGEPGSRGLSAQGGGKARSQLHGYN